MLALTQHASFPARIALNKDGRPACGGAAVGLWDYGVQGAAMAQLTSSVQSVAESQAFEPPSLAM